MKPITPWLLWISLSTNMIANASPALAQAGADFTKFQALTIRALRAEEANRRALERGGMSLAVTEGFGSQVGSAPLSWTLLDMPARPAWESGLPSGVGIWGLLASAGEAIGAARRPLLASLADYLEGRGSSAETDSDWVHLEGEPFTRS